MNPPDALSVNKLISEYHVENIFKFFNLLIFITSVIYFFKSKSKGRPGSRIILLLFFSLYCAFNGILLNSFWLGIVAIWLGIGSIGGTRYLWSYLCYINKKRKIQVIEKEKAELKQKDELLREKEEQEQLLRIKPVFNFGLLLKRINEGAYSKSDALIAFHADQNSFIELFSLEKALSLLVNTTIQAGEYSGPQKSDQMLRRNSVKIKVQ